MRARTRLTIESHGSSCGRLETLFVMPAVAPFYSLQNNDRVKIETMPDVKININKFQKNM